MQTGNGKMDTVPIFIIIVTFSAPLLLLCMSERENFPVARPATWDEAREHCQMCYKELVTVTYGNIRELVCSITQQHWIGLRQNLATDPWSRWANGEPLIFQNWYPGGRQSATTTTTPATTSAPTTTVTTTATTAPEVSTYDSSTPWTTFYSSESPMTTTREAVKEDCVAMLPSGPWEEIDCTRLLPYICYDERFDGNASFTMTTANATLSWLQAPGNISSYTVVLRGGINKTTSVTGLTYDLWDPLTPGTLYDAQVYPLKCGRPLNPQNASFYTKPLAVQNLMASNITESSAVLSWERPEGGLHSYRVVVRGGCSGCSDCTLAEWAEVTGLIPGGRYTLDVFSVVEDESAWSEAANITLFTKPHKVSNVNVSDVTNRSLVLVWTHEGNATEYLVVAKDAHNTVLFNVTMDPSQRRVKVQPITAGTQLWLTVTARANKLEGDGDTARSFIAPNPVHGLNLTSSDDSINASWHCPGAYEWFSVSVQLIGGSDNHKRQSSTTNTTFVTLGQLYTAAKYTVTVTTVAGSFRSNATAADCFTTPVKPDSASITSFNQTHAVLEWTAPGAAVTTIYHVTFNTSFWDQHTEFSVSNGSKRLAEYGLHTGTNFSHVTFNTSFWDQHTEFSVSNGSNRLAVYGLHPGTNYVFHVCTVSGDLVSKPAIVEQVTDWDRSDITLSMMCSSAVLLECDTGAVQLEVDEKLKEYFRDVLRGVKWSLKRKKK